MVGWVCQRGIVTHNKQETQMHEWIACLQARAWRIERHACAMSRARRGEPGSGIEDEEGDVPY